MDADSDGWVFLREGIERKPLASDPDRGMQMDLIRIKPDFVDHPHIHDGFEWVFVLEGSFSDSRGTHVKGSFVVNSTEGVHQVSTGKDGCTLLIVWTGSVTEVREKK